MNHGGLFIYKLRLVTADLWKHAASVLGMLDSLKQLSSIVNYMAVQQQLLKPGRVQRGVRVKRGESQLMENQAAGSRRVRTGEKPVGPEIRVIYPNNP